MTSNNETPALLAALTVTASLLGGGYWWLSHRTNFDLSAVVQPQSDRPTPSPTDSAVGAAPDRFDAVSSVPDGLFSYGGSTTWAPIHRDVDPAIQQVWPNFQLRYTDPPNAPPGSAAGIRMLIDGQLSFAQSSRPLTDQEFEAAQKQSLSLKAIPVATEGLAVAVHPQLPIDGLTLDQLKRIYLGQITNWSQVGGPNLAIVPFSRGTEGGTVEFFVETVLGGSPLSNRVEVVSTTTAALRQVTATPGAIYYASAPEIVGQCTVKPLSVGRQSGALTPPYREPFIPLEACPGQRNQPNTQAFLQGQYPLTRRLFIIVRADGSPDQQAGEAYAQLLLTSQGQQLLEQSGFVPLR